MYWKRNFETNLSFWQVETDFLASGNDFFKSIFQAFVPMIVFFLSSENVALK